ncbi:MAG: HAMP domain-containing histidine kinase, partial [Ruminococcus sp.]|nr:HAMP domain-containing histidine kinase [Ruminococcus sp.]
CIKKEYNNNDSTDNESVRQLHRMFMEEHSLMIYIYDENGNCVFSAEHDEKNAAPIQSSIKSYIDSKPYLDFDSQGLSKDEPYLLYGNQFHVKHTDAASVKMYALIYGSTYNISIFTMEIFLVYSVISLVILLFSYFIMKKKIKKYISGTDDMIRIIKQYSQGDFSEKIVTENSGFLGEMAKYINTLALNVEKSEETSKTFIANVSHELRTPITTIGGFVDGILDGTIPKNRRNEYLILVSNEIQRLSILISSMLNMSRFESGTLKPNFRKTNLTDLVIKTVFMFEKKIEEKHLEIEELDSERLVAVVDPDLMQQVIYNLIENAVKFVNDGGKLSFRFEKEGDMCIIGIKNTGEGLKDSEIPQVFDRFYKTDSSRGKDTTGLGLGLSISRRILHINNGHIVVKSVYGEYTEFQIQVPEKQNQL